MAEIEVMVLCYWNGCIKHGPDGVYYEGGSTPKKIRVNQKTELSRLLDVLYVVTGLDKTRSNFEIFGRFPVVVSPHRFTYVHLPVVDDASLETMLQVPSNHCSIKNVELYLEVKPTSDDVIDPGGCSSKRQRTQQPQEAIGYLDTNVKLERDNGLEFQVVDNSNGWIEGEANADFENFSTHGEGQMTDKNSGSDGVAQVVNLISGVLKPCESNLWLDNHELRVGLCFKDSDELKKAVDWCSIKGQQKCVVRETEKDEFMFECVRWKCKWLLRAARIEKHGFFEIITYNGPHTCLPIDPEGFKTEFEADEIERVVRVQPTLSIAELKKWWKAKIGYDLETSVLREAKEQAMVTVFGDWDQNFVYLPKLMSALHSSNGLLVDWKYNLFPNPKFASFRGVFWTFSQSIEGFQHCRDLIVVDFKDLKGEYQLKLMIASGLDAANNYFPLAFAVTNEISVDSWRWFLTGIREKVTQRKGLCLITDGHSDIVAVINEPGSLWQEPWAYHRFCLGRLLYRFFCDSRNYKLLGQAGTASQKEEFDSYMKKIKDTDQKARQWLDKLPPHQWALAHDNGGRRYGMMKIDRDALFAVCKGFELGDHVLTGSVLLLFDDLRRSFDKSFDRSRASLNCGDVYTKPVTDKLEEFRKCSVTYIVMPLEDNNAFQVTATSETNEWIVQLSNGGTCTCGGFQSNKFPCLHALAVCKKLKINPLKYVDDCYTVERYYKTYAATFAPVPELLAWPEASGVPTLFPPVIPPPLPPSLPKVLAQRKTTPEIVKKKS